jgi:hypothetical protein
VVVARAVAAMVALEVAAAAAAVMARAVVVVVVVVEAVEKAVFAAHTVPGHAGVGVTEADIDRANPDRAGLKGAPQEPFVCQLP